MANDPYYKTEQRSWSSALRKQTWVRIETYGLTATKANRKPVLSQLTELSDT